MDTAVWMALEQIEGVLEALRSPTALLLFVPLYALWVTLLLPALLSLMNPGIGRIVGTMSIQ